MLFRITVELKLPGMGTGDGASEEPRGANGKALGMARVVLGAGDWKASRSKLVLRVVPVYGADDCV
jgi:hypothetical protein